MKRQYSDCYFCGGEVKEQQITREIWWQGKLHLIEEVPVGVCQQCGQKLILPDVAKLIDRMLAGEVSPTISCRCLPTASARWNTCHRRNLSCPKSLTSV
jgi:YgiT-type zinc finger domain-containing protein